MADVKLRIEVNPNAETETLGNITNIVSGSGNNYNVANTSIKANSNGLYSNIPTQQFDGSNGLIMTDNNEDDIGLIFDEDDYLDNIQLSGGVIEDEEEPQEFIWGIVPENKEYSVKLTFSNANSLKDIVVYGDTVVGQFPTRAIIDGTTVIYSDDNKWDINLLTESSTHTIEFTHWNRANYNACITLIMVTLQYFDVDKFNGLKSVESLSQSTGQPKEIFYGCIENSGSAEIVDVNGVFDEMISDGIIQNSNVKLEIITNGKTTQHHLSYDSSYSREAKVLNIEMGNTIQSLDILKYNGFNYPNTSMSAYDLLFDVMKNLRLLTKNEELTEETFKNMLSGYVFNIRPLTIWEYLKDITIPYPVIKSNQTYREVIDEFCELAQLQMFLDDNNDVKFVSARPIVTENDFNPIHISKDNMFSKLDYSLFLKNKYDGIEASKNNVVDAIYESETVFTKDFDTSNNSLNITSSDLNAGYRDYKKIGEAFDKDSYNANVPNAFMQGAVGFVYIKPYYCDIENLIKIPKVSQQGLYRIKNLKKTIDYNLFCRLASKPISLVTNTRTLNIDSMNFNAFVDSDFVGENKNVSKTPRIDRTLESQFFDYSNTYISDSAVAEIEDETTLTITEDNDNYYVNYHILCGYDIITAGVDKTLMTWSPTKLTISGTITRYRPSYITINVLGDVRKIEFNEVSANTLNIESAKTKVSLAYSDLIQTDTVINDIKSNIISDYKNGISNANVTISCSNYYNKDKKLEKDWAKGQVIEVRDLVYFDNDLYLDGSQRYWRVTGRNFRKAGVPMVDLELQECLPMKEKTLNDYSWKEISEISKNKQASLYFKIGDKKLIFNRLNENGTTTLVNAVILGFDHDTLSDGTDFAGITFGIDNPYISYPYNFESTNVGGWDKCVLRSKMNRKDDALFRLPDDLEQSIVLVNKKTSDGNGLTTITESSDRLWLLSEVELIGHTINSVAGEGIQYDYFKNIKGRYMFDFVCFRSPNEYDTTKHFDSGEISNSSNSFLRYVFDEGNTDNSFATDASEYVYINYCFCV